MNTGRLLLLIVLLVLIVGDLVAVYGLAGSSGQPSSNQKPYELFYVGNMPCVAMLPERADTPYGGVTCDWSKFEGK